MVQTLNSTSNTGAGSPPVAGNNPSFSSGKLLEKFSVDTGKGAIEATETGGYLFRASGRPNEKIHFYNKSGAHMVLENGIAKTYDKNGNFAGQQKGGILKLEDGNTIMASPETAYAISKGNLYGCKVDVEGTNARLTEPKLLHRAQVPAPMAQAPPVSAQDVQPHADAPASTARLPANEQAPPAQESLAPPFVSSGGTYTNKSGKTSIIWFPIDGRLDNIEMATGSGMPLPMEAVIIENGAGYFYSKSGQPALKMLENGSTVILSGITCEFLDGKLSPVVEPDHCKVARLLKILSNVDTENKAGGGQKPLLDKAMAIASGIEDPLKRVDAYCKIACKENLNFNSGPALMEAIRAAGAIEVAPIRAMAYSSILSDFWHLSPVFEGKPIDRKSVSRQAMDAAAAYAESMKSPSFSDLYGLVMLYRSFHDLQANVKAEEVAAELARSHQSVSGFIYIADEERHIKDGADRTLETAKKMASEMEDGFARVLAFCAIAAFETSSISRCNPPSTYDMARKAASEIGDLRERTRAFCEIAACEKLVFRPAYYSPANGNIDPNATFGMARDAASAIVDERERALAGFVADFYAALVDSQSPFETANQLASRIGDNAVQALAYCEIASAGKEAKLLGGHSLRSLAHHNPALLERTATLNPTESFRKAKGAASGIGDESMRSKTLAQIGIYELVAGRDLTVGFDALPLLAKLKQTASGTHDYSVILEFESALGLSSQDSFDKALLATSEINGEYERFTAAMEIILHGKIAQLGPESAIKGAKKDASEINDAYHRAMAYVVILVAELQYEFDTGQSSEGMSNALESIADENTRKEVTKRINDFFEFLISSCKEKA